MERSSGKGAGQASAFAVAATQTDKHIVDVLIEERCPSFVGHWTWPLVRPLLYSGLGYRKARQMADDLMQLDGMGSFDYMADRLDFEMNIENLHHVPKTGRTVVVANHPTGLADGAAVWQALRQVRKDIVFFANADAVRVNPQFSDVMIPVEWVKDKRSPAKTRETLRLAGEAFAEEKCIVIFPSGTLARMIEGVLTEQTWHSTAIALARKKSAPIIPLHVGAKNSRLYYFLARTNAELRDITLFHELLNKKGARFDLSFGQQIPAEALAGDVTALTEQMREYVAFELGSDPLLMFPPRVQ